jgi:hypothetical protein
MSACAGSLTDASRSNSAQRRGKVWRCAAREQFGIVSGCKRKILKYFAGLVPMDRAWQDWDYEHAETGWPLRSNDRNRAPEHAARLAACTLQLPCKPSKSMGTSERGFTHVEHPSVRLRPNGVFSVRGRPRHSATGYPRRYTQSAAGSVFLSRLTACEAGRCAEAVHRYR